MNYNIELEREVERLRELEIIPRLKCLKCHCYMPKNTISFYCLKCSMKKIG